MKLPNDDEFREHGFTDDHPHPCGRIALQLLGATEGGLQLSKWGLRAGTRYPPESHSHAHVLTILAGSGVISVGGVERPYAPGDRFDIPGCVPHGFVRVDTLTVVKQCQLDMKLHRP